LGWGPPSPPLDSPLRIHPFTVRSLRYAKHPACAAKTTRKGTEPLFRWWVPIRCRSPGFATGRQARRPQQAFMGFVFLRAAISFWVALHTGSRSVAVTLDYMTQNTVMTGTSTPLPSPLHGRTCSGFQLAQCRTWGKGFPVGR